MSQNQETHVIILAAGKGVRMKSQIHKVLQKIGGKTFIERDLEVVTPMCPMPTIVVCHQGDAIKEATGNKYQYVWQKEPLGTGDAVRVTKDTLKDKGYKNIVVMYGDAPFLSQKTLQEIVEGREKRNAIVSVATVEVPNYEGDYMMFWKYGRIVRGDNGMVQSIVEFKDADDEIKKIKEVNVGPYCFYGPWLWDHVDKLTNDNASGEYYITDLIKMAVQENKRVFPYIMENVIEGFGINSLDELEIAEKELEKS